MWVVREQVKLKSDSELDIFFLIRDRFIESSRQTGFLTQENNLAGLL